ncbi:MAG TPA: PD-(D/E)XK nuclease family transposase [Polyangiaceae bacterium]|nr:PD-(D/E)XK nuclease family transposase [Polyangiaceae bacterium]
MSWQKPLSSHGARHDSPGPPGHEPCTSLQRAPTLRRGPDHQLCRAHESAIHSIFQVRERHGGELLTPQLELHLLELPKVPRAVARNDEPNLAIWAKFLSAKADEELEKLAMEHPVLKRAKAALDRLSADEVARLQAEHREMALLTYEAGIAAAREEAEQEGRTAGIQEGRTAGTSEVLLRLLTVKFGPQPANVAERLAGASQEELLRWSERLLLAETLERVFA